MRCVCVCLLKQYKRWFKDHNSYQFLYPHIVCRVSFSLCLCVCEHSCTYLCVCVYVCQWDYTYACTALTDTHAHTHPDDHVICQWFNRFNPIKSNLMNIGLNTFNILSLSIRLQLCCCCCFWILLGSKTSISYGLCRHWIVN